MVLSRLTHSSLKLTAQSNSLCELFLGCVDDQMVAEHTQCLVCVCVCRCGCRCGCGWGGGGEKYLAEWLYL